MIIIIYIFAAFVAIFTYNALNFDWWIKLLVADVAATVVTFVFSVLFSNASVYDPYWSVQPIVILAALAMGKELTPMRIMLLFAACGSGAKQDSRYRDRQTSPAGWRRSCHGLLGGEDFRDHAHLSALKDQRGV